MEEKRKATMNARKKVKLSGARCDPAWKEEGFAFLKSLVRFGPCTCCHSQIELLDSRDKSTAGARCGTVA
jgi:hypothetical protein